MIQEAKKKWVIAFGLAIISLVYGFQLGIEFGSFSLKWFEYGFIFIGTLTLAMYYGIILEREHQLKAQIGSAK